MKPSDDGLKQRLIGAVVLLAIAVIFLPVLFDRKHLEPIDTTTQIPPEPQIKTVVIEAPQPPQQYDAAPEPSEMFVPDEEASAEPAPEPPGLDNKGLAQAWVLQVASFRDAEHARAFKKKLVDSGYTAFTRESQFKNGPVVRVYIGPKLDKSALAKLQPQVDKQFDVQSLLLEFRPI